MTDALLVLNAGSSSLRAALYAESTLEPLARVHLDAAQRAPLWSGPLADAFAARGTPCAGSADAVPRLLRAIGDCVPSLRLRAAGHRVVHGGERFSTAQRIDANVMAEIERLAPLAPSHQPHAIAAIRTIAAACPGLPQVACFDTAFHRQQPRLAQLYGLPRELGDAGVVRYGFHGLSYEYLAGALPAVAGRRAEGRVICAHLGHGASLCALRNGRSEATTMGFSALDGLVMGTRCGSIDPGVLLHLQQALGYSAEQVSTLLYERSGLLGVSTISDDLRVLEASTDPRAREAIELFAYRAAREIGSLVAAVGGLDALVFSAGIGENSADMRARICARLDCFGVELDAGANGANATRISQPEAAVGVYVIPTDEEAVIARQTRALRSPGAAG